MARLATAKFPIPPIRSPLPVPEPESPPPDVEATGLSQGVLASGSELV